MLNTAKTEHLNHVFFKGMKFAGCSKIYDKSSIDKI